MQKIILYYKFTELVDPQAIKLWQQNLSSSLGLKGRIIIADHGINGSLAGDIVDLKKYIKQTKDYPKFKDIIFKWSDGTKQDFPRLSVKIRPEIVTFNVRDKIKVNDQGIIGGGKRLKPEALHKLIKQRPDAVFFDGRNEYEAKIGRFNNAVVPKVRHSRDFAQEIKKPKYQKLKNQPIITYCTGGIRCEVLSMLLKAEGFQDVYQIDGGIVKYGEKYKDSGPWQGKLYVFDKRMTIQFSDQAKDIGRCYNCQTATSNYENCSIKSCNDLILICQTCARKLNCLCKKHAKVASLTS